MNGTDTLPSDIAALKSVGFVLTRAQAQLFAGLASRLREKHGSKIHFYVRSETEVTGMRRVLPADSFDSLSNCGRTVEAVAKPVSDRSALIEEARALEKRIGQTINEVAVSHRSLGRGYSPGSLGHPSNLRFMNASYEQYLAAIVAQLRFWDDEIREKGLTLLVDAEKEGACMARANNIAFRGYIDARLETRRIWTSDEFQTNPLLAQEYARIPETDEISNLSSSNPCATLKKTVQEKRFSLRHYPMTLLRGFKNYLISKTVRRNRGYDMSLSQIVLAPLRLIASARKVHRLFTTRLEDLEDKPFAYFALQKEPEQALLNAAPHRTDQISLILDLSRNLPAGTVLAIAEHTMGIGRRPPMFYERLLALPNVVLLDMRTNPIERIRRAAVSVTVAGTVAHEAGILGRPAIVFGDKVGSAILPHVMTATDQESLKAAIDYAFSGSHDEAKAARLGVRYEKAVRAASFDLYELGADFTEKGHAIGDAHISSAYDGLVRSLAVPEDDTALPLRAIGS